MTKRQMKELESSSEDYKALAWLKESNNKMRQDLLHVRDMGYRCSKRNYHQ
jgi:hypothetical protein